MKLSDLVRKYRLKYATFKSIPLVEFIRRLYYRFGNNIYPINIPQLIFQKDLDFLLIEIPPRYLPMMPNGLGYVYNILEKTGIRFQAVDSNIIFYHRYHSQRLLGNSGPVVAPSGYPMKDDPWLNFNADDWVLDEVIEYFWPQIEEILEKIVRNRPKAVGISVHASNRTLAKKFVSALREMAPETLIVVGGYDCLYHNTAPYLFSNFDYMVIGEAELTLPKLVKSIAEGDRPKDLPGILSRYDTPGRAWVDSQYFEDINSAGFPKYEWTDLALYHTFDGQQMVPITSSRGCRWSKCRFCAECLPFKKRSPENVVDEIEFMVSKGFYKFHFNESDVNGDPENLHDICSEVLKRGLKVQFVGQLRIDKRNTIEYMRHLAKAGFTHLRFGVDGWSTNSLRLQRKGYNMNLVVQNLRASHKAGIFTSVNIVIGVPGETDADVDEMTSNLEKCSSYIDSVDSVNTLILAAGSEYYKNPEKYNIRFRGDKDEIYAEHPYFVPVNSWYSEEPYIDQEVRTERIVRIYSCLNALGITVDPFSLDLLEKQRNSRKEAS